MKKYFFTVFVLFSFECLVFSQTSEKKFEPGGKITGQIFLNYHIDLAEGVEKKSQFEILRSNFGYTYNFSPALSSRIVMDAANDGKAFSLFLKAASMEWKANSVLTFEGGMTRTFVFDTQEDFFGYRYVMESLQDREKFYSTYDLGAKAIYKPSKFIQLRAGIFNGEGFKKVQDNFGAFKKSFDIILYPTDRITFKAYYDFMPKRDTAITNSSLLYNQTTMNFFLGYSIPELLRLGIEYDNQSNIGNRKDYDLDGISLYGTYIYKKTELFARYDQIASALIAGDVNPWNFLKDYQMIMGGIQFSAIKGIRTALNYRHFIPRNGGSDFNSVYLNLEFRF